MEPFCTDEAGVPSDVWIFRLAGGKPAADGALRLLLLNRNAILCDFGVQSGMLAGHHTTCWSSPFMRPGVPGQSSREVRPDETRCIGIARLAGSKPQAAIKHHPSSWSTAGVNKRAAVVRLRGPRLRNLVVANWSMLFRIQFQDAKGREDARHQMTANCRTRKMRACDRAESQCGDCTSAEEYNTTPKSSAKPTGMDG